MNTAHTLPRYFNKQFEIPLVFMTPFLIRIQYVKLKFAFRFLNPGPGFITELNYFKSAIDGDIIDSTKSFLK
jgi:hypothetical protein